MVPLECGPGVDSVSNRNKYQDYFKSKLKCKITLIKFTVNIDNLCEDSDTSQYYVPLHSNGLLTFVAYFEFIAVEAMGHKTGQLLCHNSCKPAFVGGNFSRVNR
jgi:hypothetical protein